MNTKVVLPAIVIAGILGYVAVTRGGRQREVGEEDDIFLMRPFNSRFISPTTNIQDGREALGIVGLVGESFAGGMLDLNYAVVKGGVVKFEWDALVPMSNPEDNARSVLWYNPGGTAVIGVLDMPKNGRWTSYSARVRILAADQGPSGATLFTASLLLSANYRPESPSENTIHIRDLRAIIVER